MQPQLFGGVLFLCISSATCFAQSVTADDFAVRWQGLFAGVHGGWERSEFKGRTGSILIDDAAEIESSNWSGGGQLGYNMQFGRWIFGLEVSGSLGDHDQNGNCFANSPDTEDSFSGGGSITTISTTYRCKSSFNWTARGLLRAGYASNQGRLLSYLIGGAAVSQADVVYYFDRIQSTVGLGAQTFETQTRFGPSGSQLVGAVFGGGFKYALSENVSFGVEYLHTDYLDENVRGEATANATSTIFPPSSVKFSTTEKMDLQTDAVRMVLDYRFAPN